MGVCTGAGLSSVVSECLHIGWSVTVVVSEWVSGGWSVTVVVIEWVSVWGLVCHCCGE